MACRGVHFALTPEQEQRLLDAVGDNDAVLAVVQEEVEENWDQGWLCETDKAWDAIHRCLTGGSLDLDNGQPPLSLCILGGRQLYSDNDYFISYVSREQVGAVADALEAFTRNRFDQAYSQLYATDYDGPINDDDREYTWSNLEDLKPFWRKAANAGRAVIFTVDQ
jgi:hypothetical protein